MRIALITPEHPGCGPSYGIGRYVSDLARLLSAAGHPVLVLVASDTGRWRIEPGQAPQRCGDAPRSLLARPFLCAPWFMHQLERFQPDVIEASNWGALGLCLPGRWPLVTRLSTSAADGGGRDLLRPLRIAAERWQVRRSRILIANSRAMDRRGRELYGRAADAVIPHAWCGPIDPPDPNPRPLHAIFTGRYEHRKGLDILLAAWPAVTAAMPDAHLHLVGRGTPPSLPAGVTDHGPLDDVALAALRRRCKVQVVPSRFESFGLVVLEAWAHGLSVVASDAGALPEVVNDSGMIHRSEDAADAAQALIRSLQDDRRPGPDRLQTAFLPDPVSQTLAYRIATSATMAA